MDIQTINLDSLDEAIIKLNTVNQIKQFTWCRNVDE